MFLFLLSMSPLVKDKIAHGFTLFVHESTPQGQNSPCFCFICPRVHSSRTKLPMFLFHLSTSPLLKDKIAHVFVSFVHEPTRQGQSCPCFCFICPRVHSSRTKLPMFLFHLSPSPLFKDILPGKSASFVREINIQGHGAMFFCFPTCPFNITVIKHLFYICHALKNK